MYLKKKMIHKYRRISPNGRKEAKEYLSYVGFPGTSDAELVSGQSFSRVCDLKHGLGYSKRLPIFRSPYTGELHNRPLEYRPCHIVHLEDKSRK